MVTLLDPCLSCVQLSLLWESISENLKISFCSIIYYSDSKVALGYIGKITHRFYTYIANRGKGILSVSSQWAYISTTQNPANLESRGVRTHVQLELWLSGPDKLRTCDSGITASCEYVVVSPYDDKEMRPQEDTSV